MEWVLIYKAHIYLRQAAALTFSIWLILLWLRKRDAVYIWLLAGLGLAPTLQHLLPFLTGVTKPFFPGDGIYYARLFFWLMLECMRIGCMAIALWRIARETAHQCQ